jgi:membrane-bound lytic murein transglycosylase D
MTKSKFLKAGLIAQSLLISVASYAGNPDQDPNETKKLILTPQQVPKNQTGLADSTTTTSTTIPDSLRLLQELYESEATALPAIRLNKQAAAFVTNYLEENRLTLKEVEKRSGSYFSTIESIFRQYGIPEELKYLAVVESKLKLSAVSHAGAVGPWQLMPATARYLGLKVQGKNDERRHFYKSTVAAAKYLKSLHTQFGDWLLVLAAYNGGAGTVYKAIRRSGSRNFWALQKHLPNETRLHVKRFIGAHYYFDASGSETVLTHAEAVQYQKLLEAYEANCLEERAAFKKLIQLAPGINDEVEKQETIKTTNAEITKAKSK